MNIIKQPFDEFLGFEYERVGPTKMRVTLPVRSLHVNSAGVIHGGIISSLVDVAMSNLLEASDQGVQKAVTIDLHTTFIQGARGAKLVAEANVVKEGRTLLYADCRVMDEEGQIVARATGSFFIRQ